MTIFQDKFSIVNPIRLGIIGGGQLGKMLASEAKRMFMTVIVLDPSLECPASSMADKVIVGNFSDEQKIYELAKCVDILTYEIELGNSRALDNLVKEGMKIFPSPENLHIIQNKFRQKSFLKENGIKVPKFESVSSTNHLKSLCSKYGFPLLLKACEQSYDGRGNFLIKNSNDIDLASEFMINKECMIEEFIEFKKEISIMISRNRSGDVSYFPIVENIHRDHILDITIAPAKIEPKVTKQALELATKTIHSLNGVGIFGIEMFIDQNDKVLINEIAPRPHNSGHYSIEACSISQFEQHLRAILDYPLPKPRLLSDAVMINILGPKNFEGYYTIEGLNNLFSIKGLKIHIYGKKISKYNRKLGHITIVLDNQDPLDIANYIKDIIKINPENNNE